MADARQMGGREGEAVRDTGIVVLRDFCITLKGASCSRCADACPKGAISYRADSLPVVDTQACTQCGICLGICDAFSSTRVTMLDLHERIRRIALRGETAYITCKENVFPGLKPAPNVVVLPCLACLSPEFWTVLLSERILVTVACDLAYCADCERGGDTAEMLYSHAIATAQAWTGEQVGFSAEIPEEESLLKDLASPKGVDRRAIFTNFAGDVGDIATGKRRLRNSEVLQQFVERRERSKAMAGLRFAESDMLNLFAPTGRVKKVMHPKRQMILEAVSASPAIAPNIPVFVAELDKARCRDSGACLGTCPTGALNPDPGIGKTVLDRRYCIGCGLCVEACAHKALVLVEETAACLIAQNGGDAEEMGQGKKQVENET
ncbi:MAG: 4Fe-4S binding protein [Eggerthellaceae bacterium]|jgi:Pyruvate/2-oxoacid:ferredoxin oxidoreductase delta subunit|nr:4Fe-4S binding protein [Eggerthellaceae bacterium]MDR2715829.1 4Fe-4S binding protein [Coriobacteriaceae bacterium]